jgi:hypothetical protein
LIRLLLLPLSITAALLCAGCGYVGDPLPPLANVPGHITDLAAIQRGGRLIVHFTPPTQTTEGSAIKAPLKLDLRIGTAMAQFRAEDWAAAALRIPAAPVKNGLAEYEVPLADLVGKDVTIGARAIGSNGKDSGWSNFVNLPIVPPPAVPAEVKPDATADGVRLTWQGGPGSYRVFRRAGDEKSYGPPASVTAPEWVDAQAEFGKTYHYLVQRTVPVGAGVAESDLSAEVTITPKDTFAPAAPTGVRTIAAAGSVELTWERNTEADLAGYRVYRATGDGAFEKLDDVQVPAYSDRKVEAGKTYRYALSAVDQAGNESARSAAVTVRVE